jgi:hypothetical protein
MAAIPAGALTPIPYGDGFRDDIEAALFEPAAPPATGFVVSPTKVEAYRELVTRKLRFIQEHVRNEEIIDGGRSVKRATRDAAGVDNVVALKFLLDQLDRLERTTDRTQAYEIAAKILMVEYATRSHTEPLASLKVPVHLKNMIFDWSVPNKSRAWLSHREATNLVDPETGLFYTPEDLSRLIRDGVDLSALDPPPESPWWRKKADISSVDMVSNYFGGGDPVHEGIVTVPPPFEGAVFEYRRAHKTQSKPKLDVFWLDEDCRKKKKAKQRKCRVKVKLKFGMETQADPVANALLSALGFNVDVSMHLRNIKIYLGDATLDDLKADWASYFDLQRLHLYIPLSMVMLPGEEGHGFDEKGEYVVFRETVAEMRHPDIVRLGFFAFSSGMAQVMREPRGLFLYNVWVGSADSKDEENNKLALRLDENGEWRIYLAQHDLGHAMGLVMPERPDAFPWDSVETSPWSRFFGWIRGRSELNYINLQDSGLEHTTTYADAKWMARLIAQLTREQITDAVNLGHWPGGIGPLYVEKLIHRRNQFVELFGLEDEFESMPVDRTITTEDGSVVDGRLVQNRWEHSSMDYGHHWRDTFGPVASFLGDALKQAIQGGVGAVSVVSPGDVEITGDLVFNPEILVNISREVKLNPDATSLYDQYLVRDSLGLGVRLGIGYIGFAEGIWMRNFSVAYPAPTRRIALGAGAQVLNFLLPVDVRRGKLPEKYVLYRDEWFGKGFRLRPETELASPVGAGADLAYDWVRMNRSVVDRREAEPIVWVDQPRFADRRFRAFLELSVVEIPFLVAADQDGELSGHAFRIDGDLLADPEGDGAVAFDRMLRSGNFEGVHRLAGAPPLDGDVEFRHRFNIWRLLVANFGTRGRDDRVVLRDREGRVLRDELQVERRRRFNWMFLDNGETHDVTVQGVLGASGTPAESRVRVDYEITDLNAHSDEFEAYYRSLAGLAAGEPYLAADFLARDWEVSGEARGRWTQLLASGRIQLEPASLQRLLALSPERHWELLAEELGMSADEMTRVRNRLGTGPPKQRIRAQRAAGLRVRAAVGRSRRALRGLERARAAKSDEERLTELVESLYQANYRIGGSWDPTVMATLLSQAGIRDLSDSGDLVISARITKSFDDENNLPERRDVVGRLGPEREFDPVDYRFFPFGAQELYTMLDWFREVEAR